MNAPSVNIAADQAWQALLDCKSFLGAQDTSAAEAPDFYFIWHSIEGCWRFSVSEPISSDEWAIWWRGFGRESPRKNGGISSRIVPISSSFPDLGGAYWLEDQGAEIPRHISEMAVPLRLYLPILLGGFRAKQAGHCFAVAHLAQSLDGRIASHIGDSRWISNEANLIHAHRLRALCDGVAVGWRTAVADDCRLTVRHVVGANPTRVVFDPKAKIVERMGDLKIFSDESPTVILVAGEGARDKVAAELLLGSDVFSVNFAPEDIFELLGNLGIHSLLIEGGARTISAMLTKIPLLHLHLSPIILGSGVSSFALEPVDFVADAMTFYTEHFLLDREVLFECSHRH